MELTFTTRTGHTITTHLDPWDHYEAKNFRWTLSGGKRKDHRGKLLGLYLARKDGRNTIYLHRWVAQRMGLLSEAVGNIGSRWKISIDHINGDKLDNRRANLRLRDRPKQMRNSNDNLRSTNTSGYRGVSFVTSRERLGKPWMAYVTVDYKTKNLGWYTTAEEAADARGRWDLAQAA